MATRIHELEPGSRTEAGSAVLRVADVQKSFRRGIWPRRRRVEVLRGASLDVRPGELVGLVGENGSGKSTLMQIIVGLVARDAGSVQRPERLGYCHQLPLFQAFDFWPTAVRHAATCGDFVAS